MLCSECFRPNVVPVGNGELLLLFVEPEMQRAFGYMYTRLS